MTVNNDLAWVVNLACLTEDRSKQEQKALLRVATRADRAHNRQTTTNTNVDLAILRGGGQPCTYSDDHPKSCVCRGTGVAVEPYGGWSRLARLVEHTWHPSD